MEQNSPNPTPQVIPTPAPIVTPPVPPMPPQATVLSNPQKGFDAKIILVIVGVVFLLAALAAGVYYFMNKSQSEATQPIPVTQPEATTPKKEEDLSAELNALEASTSASDLDVVTTDLNNL